MKNNRKGKSPTKTANEHEGVRGFGGLLEAYYVVDPEPEVETWDVVHEDEGVIASFHHEKDAYLFRLMKINIALNGK